MTLRLNGSTSGYTELDAPAVAGSNTLVLPGGNGTADQALVTNGSGTLSWADRGRLVQGTAVASTSGTSIDFTGIPSWVKRVTVMFNQVSLSGTSAILVQLGDFGGVETTGYSSTAVNDSGSSTLDSTAGFVLANTGLSAATVWKGALYLNLISTDIFVGTSTLTRAGGAQYSSGVKTLSGTLDRVRITTVNGTDTFDAGSINILYEG